MILSNKTDRMRFRLRLSKCPLRLARGLGRNAFSLVSYANTYFSFKRNSMYRKNEATYVECK